MRDHVQGPALDSFGPNIRITMIIVGIGITVCLLSLLVAVSLKDPTAWTVFGVSLVLFVGLLTRQLSFRVWLHESGLSFRGIRGEHEVRWLEVERLHYGSYEAHGPHHIPLGTFHRLILLTVHGQKLSLGERVHRAEELANHIIERTRAPLLRKATQDFESGTGADFGAIRMSRSQGLIVRRWFAWRQVTWQEIEGYDLNDSHFTLHRYGTNFSWKISSQRIANSHVLRPLLNQVMEEVWRAGSATTIEARRGPR